MRTIRRTISSVLAVINCAVCLIATSAATANVLDDIEQCDGCHGKNGVSTESDVPTIAGMCAVSKELGEDVISELAEFYGSKEFVAATQEFDADKAAAGAKIHKRDCEKCHADGGSYADDDAGILAGRWMPYLKQAIANLASGEREMLEEKMRKKIEAQDTESISVLLHYYASQQ